MFALFSNLKQETIQVPIQDVPLGLPKQVKSLCPDCKQIIEATILEKDGKVWMEKKCKKHGIFEDIIYSDAKLYKRIEKLSMQDGNGLENPITESKLCPMDCGLCTQHKSYACLTNIDLTNRCNLKCPICFANANIKGYVYELSLEQIREILKNVIKTNYPNKCIVIQFSGGEPTIHPNFLEAVKMAKDIGVNRVFIATNGIKLANLDFAKKCAKAGLNAAYLQFDALDKEVYKKNKRKGFARYKTKSY